MLRLPLKVVPNSSRDRVVGWLGERLKVAVSAPPERGKANAAVLKLLARALELPAARLRLVSGEGSPLKELEVDSELPPSELLRRLPSR